jgi:hypothetical protein
MWFYYKKKQQNLYSNFLLFLVFVVFLVSIIYGRHLESTYLIVMQTAALVFFATILFFILKRYVLILLACILVINIPNWNWQNPMHPLQDGLLMSDFDTAANIITKDSSAKKINVAMEAQKDNRAMPLRYFLFLYNQPVLDYDNYQGADTLYFITRRDSIPPDFSMWEHTSFGPKKEVTKWKINEAYTMFKLEK